MIKRQKIGCDVTSPPPPAHPLGVFIVLNLEPLVVGSSPQNGQGLQICPRIAIHYQNPPERNKPPLFGVFISPGINYALANIRLLT